MLLSVSMKIDTAIQVQVDGSTMCSGSEHCTAGTGGRLSFGLTVDRNRSRLWMRRGSISVGLWMWRVPRVIGPGGPVNSKIVLGFSEQ